MKRVASIAALMLLLALNAGCSSDPVRESANPAKAADLNAQLGLRYMLNGHNDVAMEKLQKALRYMPDHAAAHHYLAELYRRNDKPEKADDHYQEALDKTPDDSSLLNNYGVFLCSQQRAEDAEEYFLRVIDNPVYRDKASVYENLGLCFRQESKLAKAEKYFRMALSENQRMLKSLISLSEINFEQENMLSARAYLQRFLALTEQTPRTLWLGIRIEKALGDYGAAMQYARELLREFPESAEANAYKESL